MSEESCGVDGALKVRDEEVGLEGKWPRKLVEDVADAVD